jgi:hypothetical protein
VNKLPESLALVHASETELAKAFKMIATRHPEEFEIREGCRLLAKWSEAHLVNLKPLRKRYPTPVNSEPARVRLALFRGNRTGGFGLLRDLQDLSLLAHQVRSGWTVILEAGTALAEKDLKYLAESSAVETDRQLDWLCTHVKVTAPQALTVPPAPTEKIEQVAKGGLKFAGTAAVGILGAHLLTKVARTKLKSTS